ncbi:MAG: type IV pilus assembly protein PilN [Gammaproteobacteria bacterium]|jgi:type IV pilus assembly protein PilN
MARINLLPWREELRSQRRTEYLTVVGICAAIALLVWGAIHWHFNERIDYQKSRNDYLQAEIKNLDKKIAQIRELEKEKDRLLARMKAIETLQTSRPIIVHIFDELVSSLPEGVYLKEISQKGKQIVIKGVAQSNARVSNYMRNVEKSEWLKQPSLDVIQTSSEDGRRIAKFTLKFNQTSPSAEAEAGDA